MDGLSETNCEPTKTETWADGSGTAWLLKMTVYLASLKAQAVCRDQFLGLLEAQQTLPFLAGS
jgi:hypothetical protein